MVYIKIYLNHIKYFDIAYADNINLSKYLPFLPRYKLHKMLVLYKTGRGVYKKYGNPFYLYQTQNNNFQIYKLTKSKYLKLNKLQDILFDKYAYFKVFIKSTNKTLIKFNINSINHFFVTKVEQKFHLEHFLNITCKNYKYEILDSFLDNNKSIYKYILQINLTKSSIIHRVKRFLINKIR